MHTTYERLRVDENCLFHWQEFIQKRFTSPFHIHDEFELILIVKSNGKLYIGNEVANFSDGDIFLIAPGIPHCFYNTKGYEANGEMAHAIVAQFKYDFLGEGFFDKTESYKLKKMINFSEFGLQFINPSKILVERFHIFKETKEILKLGNLLLILGELAEMKDYRLLSKDLISRSNLSESQTINNVILYVAENFQEALSLEEAAQIANMQKSAFCRFFKRRTKKKFMEFVNETRIAHAQKLLAETDKNIIEVAYECGYESASYFYRLFKQYNKMSPVNYRKQAINKFAINQR